MDQTASNFAPHAELDDGSCEYIFPGCMDPEAENFDPAVRVTVNDGSCEYLYGCTDENNPWFDPDATRNDPGLCAVLGCTDQRSPAYDWTANVDDGSCWYCKDKR